MGNCAACEDTQEFDQNTEVNLQKKKRIQENFQNMEKEQYDENEYGKENILQNKDTEKVKRSGKHDDYQSLAGSRVDQLNSSSKKDRLNPLSASKGFQNGQQQSMNSNRQSANKLDETSDHIPPHLNKLDQLPDFSNEFTREVLEKLGEFVYDQDEEESFLDLPFFGPCEMENNAFYIGQWRHGQRWGRGKQVWSDGSQYEGYWKNDMANGKGRLIHADGDVFEGNWLNDKAHGKGVYIHRDGASYSGDWFEDKQHGFGVEKWIDGASYEGNYFMGMKHGHGVFTWADSSIYKGEFQNNNIDGRGSYKWADGREYDGTWRDNKMHGKGVFTWKDGRKYIGEYIDDKKHGLGEFYWPDGRVYKGYWENGKQHGRGFYKGSNGREREGEWKEGKKIRWLDE
ncbi:hypothetical protein ABPG74_001031 [Tetrahymena malaccensis]